MSKIVRSLLRSSYIFFVSPQIVSDPSTPEFFSLCFACLWDGPSHMHTSDMRKALNVSGDERNSHTCLSCLDLTILTWLFVAGWVYLLRLDKQFVSFRLPIPDNDLMFSLVLPQSLRTYPMNTSDITTFTSSTYHVCRFQTLIQYWYWACKHGWLWNCILYRFILPSALPSISAAIV